MTARSWCRRRRQLRCLALWRRWTALPRPPARQRLPHDLALARPDAIRCAVSKRPCHVLQLVRRGQTSIQGSRSRAQARIMFHARRPVPERAVRNLKRAHGVSRVFARVRHEGTTGPLCVRSPRTPSACDATPVDSLAAAQLAVIRRQQRQLHVRSLGVAAPRLVLQTVLSALHHELDELREMPVVLTTAGSAGTRLQSSSRNHPQPEAALVSAGRRLRWSRTFPFQRARARELLHLCCAAVAAAACSAAAAVIYVHTLLRPLLIQFIFVRLIHDLLTNPTPFLTLSHLFDGVAAIHSTAQSNGYKGPAHASPPCRPACAVLYSAPELPLPF